MLPTILLLAALGPELTTYSLDTNQGTLNKLSAVTLPQNVQEAWPQASVGSWLAATIQEELFDYLDAPVTVLSGRDCPYPYAKNLEKLMAPTHDEIVETARKLCK